MSEGTAGALRPVTERAIESGAPEPLDFAGSGDALVHIQKPPVPGNPAFDPQEQPMLFLLAHDAPEPISVIALDADGVVIRTLVETTTPYVGEQFLEGSVEQLSIQASGPWHFQLRTGGHAQYLNDAPDRSLEGTGDTFLLIGAEGWAGTLAVELFEEGEYSFGLAGSSPTQGVAPATFGFVWNSNTMSNDLTLRYQGRWRIAETDRYVPQ